MITVQVHGFAHRLLNNGLVQSAPVAEDGTFGEFDFRGAAGMNLSGGDEELIRSTLERLTSVFPAEYKLPVAQPTDTAVSHETRAL
jgi:hypothetical protein